MAFGCMHLCFDLSVYFIMICKFDYVVHGYAPYKKAVTHTYSA